MPKCTRKGCGKDYDEDQNTDTSCSYHSGGPVFHEGLKSWSCCSDVNKPVLDFESFLAIPGCCVGIHSKETPRPEAPKSSGVIASGPRSSVDAIVNGQEKYSSVGSNNHNEPTSSFPVTFKQPMAPPPPLTDKEEEDAISIPVSSGTPCKRRGCDAKFVSEEESRGDGEGAVCSYHPSPPIFHEGSKGYLCCKRRVLEFDEFLKIKGCKTGRHLFVSKRPANGADELVACRIDHYQTPTQVHVSVFAKQTDKVASSIRFEGSKVHLDLRMPSSKCFKRTLELFGPIDAEMSKYTIFNTKVELVLVKADTRSWTLLEKSDLVTANYNLTFGVGGRTGTVGAKDLVLDDDNKLRSG